MRMTTTVAVLIGFISHALINVKAYPSGAPSGACSTIQPGHGASTASDPAPGGFYLYSDLIDNGGSYQTNTAYTIMLQGDSTFNGFLIQARMVDTTTPIGSFSTPPPGSKYLTCSGVGSATVTHDSKTPKTSLTFTWTSPSTAGTVEFRYAVVRNSPLDYFHNLNAGDYRPPSASSTVATQSTTTTSTNGVSSTTSTDAAQVPSPSTTSTSTSTTSGSSTSSKSVMPTNFPVTCPKTNKNADSMFPVVFREPDGCERESCTLYYATGPNNEDSNYLDVYMEGTVNGWMALGFSENQLMTSTDVLGCKLVSGTDVEVFDGWNLATARNFVEDDSQDGICVHMTEYSGMRLKCLFSRSASVSNAGQDYDLSNPLYIIRGSRNAPLSGSDLQVHDSVPTVSSEKYAALQSCPGTSKTSSSSFPITIGYPTGCIREINCTAYWAMGPNDQNSAYLDIYLEGNVNGWIGIGFSKNKEMAETDVLGCRVNSDNTVTVVDGWNSATVRINELDNSQDGICSHTTMNENGRISCLFSRYSVGIDEEQDFDLDNSFYLMTGSRSNENTMDFLMKHTTTPITTAETYNPLKDSYSNVISSPTNNVGCPKGPGSDADYPVTLGNPGDDYYFGARLNDESSDYLDITLEASAGGWVAVGFSESSNMFSADVLGCKKETDSDTVNVIDTWNPGSSRTNILDSSQDGVCQHSTEYTDNRIKCTFSRLIEISNDGEDLNLNSSLYQLYFAVGSFGGPASSGGFSQHSKTPTVSDQRFSLATDAFVGRELTATEWPKKALIQTHGVFMIISWILLASVGIFYASWMKPLLPNGEWFQVHRAVMVGSLVVGIFGFIFAFIAHARNTDVPGIMNFSVPSKGLKIAHFAFGWIIVVFHVLNPLIALLRCDPGKPKRWIFNLIHGHLIGFLVEMMAFVNVAMGIYLIEKTQATYYGKRALYVFVAFLVGFFAIQLMNFIFYSIKAMGAPEEDRPKLVHSLLKYFITHLTKSRESVTMTKGIVDDKAPEKQGKPGRKQPLEDAPVIFGWISMAAYVTGVVIIVLVLIIMIAVL